MRRFAAAYGEEAAEIVVSLGLGAQRFKIREKLAQLGQRLINGTAKKLADEFFSSCTLHYNSGAPRHPNVGWERRWTIRIRMVDKHTP